MNPDPRRHVVIDDAYYAEIPQALLYDPTISAEAVRVYGVLYRHGQTPENCFPSHKRIAGLIGKAERSVPSWIRQLEEAGWITRVPRWRRADEISYENPMDDEGESWEPTSNAYHVHRAAQRDLRAGERIPLRAGERGGSTLDSAPKESNGNESKSERGTAMALILVDAPDPLDACTFNDFWAAYPKKSDKKSAERAFAKAIRRANRSVIVEAALRYRQDPNRDDAYTKNATTWLNGDCWENPPLPSRGSRSSAQAKEDRTMDSIVTTLAGRIRSERQQELGTGI